MFSTRPVDAAREFARCVGQFLSARELFRVCTRMSPPLRCKLEALGCMPLFTPCSTISAERVSRSIWMRLHLRSPWVRNFRIQSDSIKRKRKCPLDAVHSTILVRTWDASSVISIYGEDSLNAAIDEIRSKKSTRRRFFCRRSSCGFSALVRHFEYGWIEASSEKILQGRFQPHSKPPKKILSALASPLKESVAWAPE